MEPGVIMAAQNFIGNLFLNSYREGEKILTLVCFVLLLKRKIKNVWHLQSTSSVWRPLTFLPSIFPSVRIFSNESAHNIKQIILLPADALKEDTLIWIPVKTLHFEPKVKNPTIWNGWGWLPSLFFLFFFLSFLFVFNCLCSCFTALLKQITSGGLWKL